MKEQGYTYFRRILYSLQSRLQIITFLIVLIPMLLASATALYLLKNYLGSDARRQLQTSVSAAVLSYRHEVNEVERSVMTVALSNRIKTTLRLGILGQLQQTLQQLATQYELDFLVVTDGMGNILASPFPGRELNTDLYAHPVLYQAMVQGIYSGAMLEENVTLLHFLELQGKHIDFTPIVTIEAALPVFFREKVVGYVLGGIMISGNEQILEEFRLAASCDRVHLVAGNRIAAVSPDREEPLTHGIRFPEPLEFGSNPSGRASLLAVTSVAGKEKQFFAYQSLPMPEEESLIAVVCSSSLANFHLLLARIRQAMAGIFFVGMLIAVLLTTMMSRSIAAPLKRLTHAMGDMRSLGMYRPLTENRDDELGNLVRGFNQMAATLEERIGDLHDEVEQRKRTEQKLASESERLQVILQSIDDGVLAVDLDGKVVLLNRVAAELTGWQHQEAQGRQLEEIFPVTFCNSGKPVENVLASVFETKTLLLPEGDLLLMRRDGLELQVTESATPLQDANGQVIGAVIVVRDVSEQRLMEEELAKGNLE